MEASVHICTHTRSACYCAAHQVKSGWPCSTVSLKEGLLLSWAGNELCAIHTAAISEHKHLNTFPRLRSMHRVTSITHSLGKGVRGSVHSGNWRSDIGEQSVAVKLCVLRDPPSASCHADLEVLWCQRVSKADMRMQNVMHVYDAFWVPMDEFEQHRQRFRPHLNKIGITSNGNTPVKCAVTIAQHLDGAIVMVSSPGMRVSCQQYCPSSVHL